MKWVTTTCLSVSLSITVPICAQPIIIPLGGNSWEVGAQPSNAIDSNGIENWRNANQQFTSYVRITKPGTLQVWLQAHGVEKAQLSIGINNKTKWVNITNSEEKFYYGGDWAIKDTGYIAINIAGKNKQGCCFPGIRSLKLQGTVINDNTSYVKNNEGNFFYWGRRGPSTHLNYALPQHINAEWFYNEVTVPIGNDIVGSYFMANGFGEGYFGMQVNDKTERRILFSVWSPYETDDPKAIPEDHKIIMLRKGNNVYAGEFGNEGAGGQSILKYNWKAGNTYRFLLHAIPAGTDHTVYTAYFFDLENNRWLLIASFKRPKKATYLTQLHSFLENFMPERGNVQRQVFFGNQWVRDANGIWYELTRARFSADNTARTGYRKDYAGGTKDNNFYLKGFGFFNHYTAIGTMLERKPGRQEPQIDFAKLP